MRLKPVEARLDPTAGDPAGRPAGIPLEKNGGRIFKSWGRGGEEGKGWRSSVSFMENGEPTKFFPLLKK
jgi:hypothetical protein